MSFLLARIPIEIEALAKGLRSDRAGAYVDFQGWVRNHNEGRSVERLEYEVFDDLALTEGQKVLDEALRDFDVEKVGCVHRVGALEIGDVAVWAGATAAHRDAAFHACRYIIDEVKARVPIWKKEFYVEGESGWINAPRAS